MMRGTDRLIVALDTKSLASAVAIAKRLRGLIRYVKIGSTLFTTAGPSAIRAMHALGLKVFLDLKFHDIPSTVELSARAAVRLGVSMLTVHACGEPAMLEAALRGARREARRLGRRRPRVVGVTVLTSVASGGARRVNQQVLALAIRAKRAGLDGVVASAQEAQAIRRRCGASWLVVCPGIRPAGVAAGDQARVVTPREAVARGADALIIGRPITHARDPRAVVRRIVEDLNERHPCSHETSS